MTYGLSGAGYDIRVGQAVNVPHGQFSLASSMEKFHLPTNVLGIVHDKSSWARRGLAVQNTVLEPGWTGYLTLELSNHAAENHIFVRNGSPIAQVVFHYLDEPAETPYTGKYQNQQQGPQPAIYEEA